MLSVRMTQGVRMTALSVIPRHYWESKARADPHLREDDGVGVRMT